MKFNVFNDVTKLGRSVTNSLKHNDSDILVGVGIAGGVISTVMACVASFKLGRYIQEKQRNS